MQPVIIQQIHLQILILVTHFHITTTTTTHTHSTITTTTSTTNTSTHLDGTKERVRNVKVGLFGRGRAEIVPVVVIPGDQRAFRVATGHKIGRADGEANRLQEPVLVKENKR